MEVSIVIACYNCENIIERTLESISTQTYKNYEVIIIDDYSTDNTYDKIKKIIENDSRFILFRNKKNMGLTKSLIYGIRQSKGKYIARIDAGDLMKPDRLMKQVEILNKKPEVGLVSSFCEIIKVNDGKILEKYVKKIDSKNLNRQMALSNKIEHATTMFTRKIYDDVNGYNEKFFTSQDYDLWIRLMQKSQVIIIPEILSTSIYELSTSITYNKNKKQLKNGILIRINAFNKNLLPKRFLLIGILKALIMLILPNSLNNFIRKKYSSVRVEAN